MKRRIIILAAVLAIACAAWYFTTRTPQQIIITGIVTTEDVIVGPEVQGKLENLYVDEGDHVKQGDLLAKIKQEEWQKDQAYYDQIVKQAQAQVEQAKAGEENAVLNFNREDDLYKKGVESKQNWDQARTAKDGADAQLDAAKKQLDAATAQAQKAGVQLEYTEVRSPVNGVVDFRAARQGEVVNMGQGIVTLINEDDLWVRGDVEETYVNSIHLKDKMTVILPSGEKREGTVFFIGVDADYATQRDVSRTKRDIKTFEIRLRCDNKDRSLALGETAYVVLPLKK